ncbi:MAG: mitochondrial fission ELM1 family protein [Candidatus Omnitrophica bacterium]|nr:mitochondrial fission ELM1 family protein [Candidatus Omnitrophota bacterium]
MNKDSIIDFLGFVAVKALAALFFCASPGFALWIGRRIGDIAYAVNIKRRSIAYANLKAAFPEKKSRELKKINRAHFQNLVMSVVEFFKLPAIAKRYLDDHAEVRNFERIDEALDKGKGIIILAGHFGNWEMASLAVSSRGHVLTVFVREQKHKRLNDLLNSYRRKTGCRVITKGFSIREIIKTLHGNGIVAILMDQDAGPNGVFVDFFGRPASTAPGAMAFAIKTGATILPTFVRRPAFNKHEIIMNEPFSLVSGKDKDKDIKEYLKKISAVLESYIRKFPDQWLWSHKRWKSTPERRVLVLTDGKTGHLNQAMAAAEMVEGAMDSRLKARGIKEAPVVKIEAAELKFKNKFARGFLDLSSLFASRRCQGCLRCLKFCLEKESFEKIKGYADIVISCGASTAATNIFLKYDNNAKNIIMMKPGLGRAGKFDLIILPRHDAPEREGSNILITETAPNRIKAKTKGEGLRVNGIGLLIGGDAKGFKLTKESVKKVVEEVLRIAEELDYYIFVTTSRRTLPEIDSFLKDRLGNCKRCKLLIIANEKNTEGAVQDILSNSDVVIVSPESVSMISEAVSSGRYTVIFKSERLASKYERTIENLERQGYIKITKPERIYNVIKEILIERPVVKKLEDKEKIIKRLQGII